MEFKYSLWTDLCGEQTEFQDAFDQLSYHQFLKINVFNLFDFSTIGHEMVQIQKQNFAKNIISQVSDAQNKLEKVKKEIMQVNRIIEAQRNIPKRDELENSPER